MPLQLQAQLQCISSYQMQDKSWMIDGSIISNNPTLIGYAYSKKILETNNINT